MSSPQEIFNKHANAYQDRFMNLDLYNDTYDALYNELARGSAVLEVGCGPANISRYLLSKRPDLKITGIDIAENMIALAKQNCPSADFRVMDCKNISALDQKFDAIVCGFCIPYLNVQEVTKLVSDSVKLLKPKGVLYISAIEGDYDKSGYQKSSNGEDECFVHFYNEVDLKEIIEIYNFDQLLVFRKEFGDSRHLVMTARKK